MRKTANFEGILAFNIAQQQGDQYNIFSVSPVWFMFARTSFFFFFQHIYTEAFWKFDYCNANYFTSAKSITVLS